MIYIISSVFIILLNVVPAFMPPTWSIVSYLYIKYAPNLIIISIVAAISSSIGRFLLSKISTRFTDKVLSISAKENILFLGNSIKGHSVRAFLFTFIWAISPLASNPLFIALGLAKTHMKHVIIGFLTGRLLSYSALAYTSSLLFEGIRDMFSDKFLDFRKIILEIISLSIIFLYLFIDWKILLVNKRFKLNFMIFKKKKVIL